MPTSLSLAKHFVGLFVCSYVLYVFRLPKPFVENNLLRACPHIPCLDVKYDV